MNASSIRSNGVEMVAPANRAASQTLRDDDVKVAPGEAPLGASVVRSGLDRAAAPTLDPRLWSPTKGLPCGERNQLFSGLLLILCEEPRNMFCRWSLPKMGKRRLVVGTNGQDVSKKAQKLISSGLIHELDIWRRSRPETFEYGIRGSEIIGKCFLESCDLTNDRRRYSIQVGFISQQAIPLAAVNQFISDEINFTAIGELVDLTINFNAHVPEFICHGPNNAGRSSGQVFYFIRNKNSSLFSLHLFRMLQVQMRNDDTRYSCTKCNRSAHSSPIGRSTAFGRDISKIGCNYSRAKSENDDKHSSNKILGVHTVRLFQKTAPPTHLIGGVIRTTNHLHTDLRRGQTS